MRNPDVCTAALSKLIGKEKAAQFIQAAAAIGRTPQELLTEALDLCADTTIALAAFVERSAE